MPTVPTRLSELVSLPEIRALSQAPILFCGDVHGNFAHILPVAQAVQPCAVVLLGDIQSPRPLHVELADIADKVWFIHGNHDTDSQQDFDHLWGSQLAHRNVHGRVVTLPNGLRLAGVGGVFRQRAWHPSKPTAGFHTPQAHAAATPRQDRFNGGPHRKHWSSIYPGVLENLAAQSADILITHEAPSCHPNGFAVLDGLARAMGVRWAFHGHQHDSLDYSAYVAHLGFQVYGVGLRGIVDLQGKVLQAGSADLTREDRAKLIQASPRC